MILCVIFFFKQKTAYEMRISDWSSDVCSSDLEANAKLAAIVEHSDDAILSKSLDGIIASWNSSAERLFGYSADEAIGKPITLLIPDDRLHEEDMLIGGVREGRRPEHFETLRRRKKGPMVTVSLSVSPVLNEPGTVLGEDTPA